MSNILQCCVIHSIIGYIIGFVFILIISIIQTNDFAKGNSYTKEHIIENYIYDIKWSAMAGIVGLIVGFIVGGVFEMICHDKDIHRWKILIVPVITIALVLISYLTIFFIGLSNSVKRK